MNDEKWDNLILLDACRYDVFKDVFIRRSLRGILSSRISRGTGTLQFLRENFQARKYEDVVYVTAKREVSRHLRDRFHAIVPVWRESWNHDYMTVFPESTYAAAIGALHSFPRRRLIIHFKQPHQPYRGVKPVHRKLGAKRPIRVYTNYVGRGYYELSSLKEETLRRLYVENLEWVMDYVEKLLEELPGTTVVTSDHGEALGERMHRLLPLRVYGHVLDARMPVLVKVPWLTSYNVARTGM